MPRIRLKPKSAEFIDAKPKPKTAVCDMPGCRDAGEHRAPKDRSLKEYYNFCFEHAKDYNKAWDFFSGMTNDEIEEHVVGSLYGDRPTWRYATAATAEEILKKKAWQAYHFTDREPPKDEMHWIDTNTPEYEALAIMGLTPPVSPDEIKLRYKMLAKKHHPDLNKGCQKSEELLKRINMAYTILKLAGDRFKDLPERG